jgi:hypothetical protein
MNTIQIKRKVDAFTEIQVPYYGKSDFSYICITKQDEDGYLLGFDVSRVTGAIRTLVLHSEFRNAEPCSPAEFAAAFEEAHHNLRAEYEAIIQAQEGGKA